MNRLLLLLIGLVVFVSACNDAAPPVRVANTPSRPAATPGVDQHGHAAGDTAPRISLEDAKRDFDLGTAVFIDTHAPDQYAQRHVKGAINVPANQIEAHVNKIPKGKKIIAYCS